MTRLLQSQWPMVYERIRLRLDVTPGGSTRSLYGESNLGEPDPSWLSDPALIESLLDPSVVYVVYSYQIPIGWTDGERWTIHYALDSKTTRGHVNHLRRALTEVAAGGRSISIPGRLSYPRTYRLARRILLDLNPEKAPWRSNMTAERRGRWGDAWTDWELAPEQYNARRHVPKINDEEEP